MSVTWLFITWITQITTSIMCFPCLVTHVDQCQVSKVSDSIDLTFGQHVTVIVQLRSTTAEILGKLMSTSK